MRVGKDETCIVEAKNRSEVRFKVSRETLRLDTKASNALFIDKQAIGKRMARRKLTDEEVKAAADRAEGKSIPDDDVAITPTIGRPTSYDPAYVGQVGKLCELGATDAEIAEFFGVNEMTFYRWKAKYPKFCEAIKTAKKSADERVERSLYHKATGYTFTSEKIFQHDGEIIRARTREHVPPDTTACIFWLKNRRPDQWREKSAIDLNVTGEVKFIVEGAPTMKTVNPPIIEQVASAN